MSVVEDTVTVELLEEIHEENGHCAIVSWWRHDKDGKRRRCPFRPVATIVITCPEHGVFRIGVCRLHRRKLIMLKRVVTLFCSRCRRTVRWVQR